MATKKRLRGKKPFNIKTGQEEGQPENQEAYAPVPSKPEEASPNSHNDETTNGTYGSQKKKEPYWQRFLRRWLIVAFTGGLTIYTALLYTLTVRQANEASINADSSYALTKRVADTQERFAKIETRAYIGVDDIIPDRLVVGRPVTYQVKFTNYGKTPAYDVRYFGGWKTGTGVYAHEISEVDSLLRSSAVVMIGAGQQRYADSPPNTATLRTVDSTAIFSEKLALFVYGKIVYRDKFGEWHYTNFAFQYTTGKSKFYFYKEYNDAD